MSYTHLKTFRSLDRFERSKVLAVLAIVLQLLTIVAFVDSPSCSMMAAISLVQLAFLLAVVAVGPGNRSFALLFLIVNWIFNCGHFVCIAAGATESINLDFRLYGSPSEYMQAFRFYLIAQSLIALGIVLFRHGETPVKKYAGSLFNDNADKVGIALVLLGFPFRLYVDYSRFAGALASGYEGVYSLVIPAPLQAVAFFFDAGMLMLLLIHAKERKGVVLFWAMLGYKVIVMSTGARQEALCFIVIWCLLYFGHLRKMSFRRAVGLIASGVVLLLFVDAFGEMRTSGFSLEYFMQYLSEASFLNIIWDSFGEFGCAFTTLVVSIADVPSLVDFGFGRSYLAGLLSPIPTFVGNFPNLKSATLFTQMLPNTSFFGGSMLGEFYYNFGWFGLTGALLTGGLVAFCQDRLSDISLHGDMTSAWFAAMLAVFLLLFVRGYFTDFVMKFVYVLLFGWVVASWFRDRKRESSHVKRMELGNERGK